MDALPIIRSATEADAPGLLAVYRPYVERTAASFELETPTVENFAGRIRKSLDGWAWLVADVDGRIAGYAYGTSHRERAAYRHTVETSAYVAELFHGRGIGTTLYRELFRVLHEKGFHRAVAGITLPNAGSVALHERLGFERVGIYREMGFKFGVWHDTAWYQRAIAGTNEPRVRNDTAKRSASAGTLHHVEMYVASLEASRGFWEPLLRALKYELHQAWAQGFSFKRGDTYLVFVQAESPHVEAGYHRRRVGLNHLAFHATSRAQVDALQEHVRASGHRVLYADRYPYAGGPGSYAMFCADPDGIKVEVVAGT